MTSTRIRVASPLALDKLADLEVEAGLRRCQESGISFTTTADLGDTAG